MIDKSNDEYDCESVLVETRTVVDEFRNNLVFQQCQGLELLTIS